MARVSQFLRARYSLIASSAARVVSEKAGRDVAGVKWSWPQVHEAFRRPRRLLLHARRLPVLRLEMGRSLPRHSPDSAILNSSHSASIWGSKARW